MNDNTLTLALKQYKALNAALTNLVATLQLLEPGGTLIEDIRLIDRDGSQVRISFTAQPLIVIITQTDKRFIFKLIDQ